jgi:hypothetical protein
MQTGLSHHSERSAWRLVSEDSGDCRSFLLIVRTLRFSLQLAAVSTEGILGVSSIWPSLFT